MWVGNFGRFLFGGYDIDRQTAKFNSPPIFSAIQYYVEYVSSQYIISWVLLSLTSTASWTLRVLLADVIPWINKASLLLYIACMLCAMLWPTWCLEAVYFVACKWKLSVSRLTVGLRLHLCDWGAGLDCACMLCTHYIDDLLPYKPLCSYWACGQVFHNQNKCMASYTYIWENFCNFKVWINFPAIKFLVSIHSACRASVNLQVLPNPS